LAGVMQSLKDAREPEIKAFAVLASCADPAIECEVGVRRISIEWSEVKWIPPVSESSNDTLASRTRMYATPEKTFSP
jgi:hypothetical protein